ncbi:MAG: hypothetical protein NVS1B16_05330 [Pseudarthrobacter sp.]
MPFVINETMGAYSELLMLLAAGTYTVAFIAFAWDLAKSSKALRAIDLKAAAAAGAVPETKVPVAAGIGAAAGTSLNAGAGANRVDSHLAGPAGRAERPSSSAAKQTGTGSAAGQTADADMRRASRLP